MLVLNASEISRSKQLEVRFNSTFLALLMIITKRYVSDQGSPSNDGELRLKLNFLFHKFNPCHIGYIVVDLTMIL